MSNNDKANRHLVCTYDEALKIIEERTEFFVANCGCRERKGGCKRSRMDLCLQFGKDIVTSGSNKREIDRNKAHEILSEAITKKLVSRPFRDNHNPGIIGGICFCCDDCCGVFLGNNEHCDKGNMIETTIMEDCIECGECVQYCYFKCREIINDKLMVNRDECYGCGLCVEVCPVKCIQMVKR